MGTIMLRDLDDKVLRGIVKIADRNGVSIDDQAKRLLADGVQISDRYEIVARLRAIAAMTPSDVVQIDSTEILRDERSQ